MHARAIALVLLLAASSLAGCAGRPDETVQAGGNVVPLPVGNGSATPGARFEVVDLVILRVDGREGALYEDDAGALVRYVVREPSDATSAETAFVTYLFQGRIVDVVQLKLAPGESKTFERRIEPVRGLEAISVEVRAATSVAKAEAEVLEWPRAGEDTLTLGPLQIRGDFGLVEDGRALVNLTLSNVGPEQPFREFRAKMLCVLPNGTLRATNSVRVEVPEPNTVTGVDVSLDDCGTQERYGIELKARGADGDLVGRLLFVPRGWEPPSIESA